MLMYVCSWRDDMSENESDEDIEHQIEFEFAIPRKNNVRDFAEVHNDIASLLNLSARDEFLQFVFKTIVTLCDPYTQPEETEKCILSVGCISDLLISIVYTSYTELNVGASDLVTESIKFEISTTFFHLLQLIHTKLNVTDEIRLRFVDNGEENWQSRVKEWTPVVANTFTLGLLYSMACVLVMSIQKLFTPKRGDYNLAMNPYLHYFLKLWKSHTNVILLGLEIDRRIEFENHERNEEKETPEIIVSALKGSSSIRYVLAWVINQNPSSSSEEDSSVQESKLCHDLENEPIFNFIQPLARKTINGGAISVDMRLITIGLLILYSGTSFVSESYTEKREEQEKEKDEREEKDESESKVQRQINRSKPLAEIGDLLVDLEYADRFDEDIKYMLEYDLDDDDDDDDGDDDNEDEDEDEEGADDESTCNKTSHEEKSLAVGDGHDSDTEQALSNENVDIQFDEFGRDWRDIPRGENAKFKQHFLDKFKEYDVLSNKSDSDDFFTSWKELHDVFDFLCVTSIEGNADAERLLGQTAVNTIAKCVMEYKKSNKGEKLGNVEDVMPEVIHSYWSSPAPEEFVKVVQESNKSIIPIFSITHFELIFQTNSRLARAMMDEMLMCEGHRRMLIWYLTHEVNLSNLLIDYVFQLAAGLRGRPENSAPYEFSRQGDSLILSEVELSMLLNEFFTNSAFYLSADKGLEIDGGYEVILAESIAKKIMTLLCLMINQLVKLKIIRLEASSGKDDIHDYNAELSSLLIRWIGKVPDARQLYFKIKNANNEPLQVETANRLASEAISLEDERKLFAIYEDMSSESISDDLDSNARHKNILASFTKRMESNLSIVLGKEREGSKDLERIERDFRFFFDNFNLFGKIENFVEALFRRFEAVITSGDPAAGVETTFISSKANEEKADTEAEFSFDFLNGEGQFEERPTKEKPMMQKSKSRKT
ncbi:hypothetical protein KGF56_001490 [Candida oxycetoniae]|uniref:Uncharacterized protein n=1 Tax=Candida oxycetoniae TaxID=497107 RepID=A0AAI9SZY2_9ASCO|nr:uncharacterized protein KGF56_001490 [Candida oxycetoniae]KAI3405882.2 hypothetical protein KGF56_001490 [Candida oxycetoniae]